MSTQFYVCPECKRPTRLMRISDRKHQPTTEEIASRPLISDMGLSHEVLICPCGNEPTWFDVMILHEVSDVQE